MLAEIIQSAAQAGQWLLTPASGMSEHHLDASVAWHGRLMTLAWLVLVPVSVIIARFCKVTPRQDWPNALDNPFWFIWHRRIGYGAAAIMLAALAAIAWFKGGRFDWGTAHALAGWLLIAVGVAQITGALLRGTHGGPVNPFTRQTLPPEQWHGDHYSMTRRRILFEYIHKYTGYAALPVIVIAVLSGLDLADAPRWMWIGAGLLLLGFLAVFAVLQARGRCLDTYQAIWGLDPNLPGNARARPVGFGILRYRCVADGAHDADAR
jgi:hypothetical protein